MNVGDNEIGDAGAVAIGKAIEENSTLTELSLGIPIDLIIESNKIGDRGAAIIGQALKRNNKLSLLNLSSSVHDS